MRMLSGRRHWLMVGLALLVSAQGLTLDRALAEAPLKPAAAAKKKSSSQTSVGHGYQAEVPAYGAAYGMGPATQGLPPGMPGMMPEMMQGVSPASGMMPNAPMSMSFPGPAPGEVIYAGAFGGPGCDASTGCGCGACGGGGSGGGGSGSAGLFGRNGGGVLGGGATGRNGTLFGSHNGGVLGGGGILNGGGGMGGGCPHCRGAGCYACGANGSLLPGRLLGALGPLAPFAEGGGSQRWFDIYAGTIGLRRTGGFGNFASANAAGVPTTTNLISTVGPAPGGTTALTSTQLDMDKMRYGLELMANLQTGVGTNLEARYFGLNSWTASATAFSSAFPAPPPNLFSVFSLYGTNPPPGGFDDTDRSFIHTISYTSELHNGEVNFRRRFLTPVSFVQGSLLAGVRYFDLDEAFTFRATGSNNNTFTANQLRFFNFATNTRNQLTGFQIGGDAWATIVPGIQLGVEGKSGIYGNHAEVNASAVSNSIAGANEFLQDGTTAYLGELTASMIYRLTYSISVKTSYNFLYVDNVALAAENVNTRDFSNALGGGAFTQARFPFIDVDGEVIYQGWSIGGEYLW